VAMASQKGILERLLSKWFDSLRDPAGAQEAALLALIAEYSRTGYGEERGAFGVSTMSDFVKAFPVLGYDHYAPMVQRALHGEPSYLCSSKPLAYAMTRGTGGKSKVVPCTQSHLDRVFECGARELICQAYRTDDISLLEGYVLNLNFPSTVTEVSTSEGTMRYGYSSGTYAKLKPTLGNGGLVPPQETIDALGPGIGRKDWLKRFDAVYQHTRDLPVVAVMGVSPVILAFGRHVKSRYGRAPSEIWRMKSLFCTSVAKIHSIYGPQLQRLFGRAPVREIYSATEGVFAQQLDSYPYVVPNYDAYLFEAKVGGKVLPLHELRRGQWGRLIVSTPVFPRYDIGDMIECLGPNYFRIFGRARPTVVLEHVLYRISTAGAA
jgi:hypothetical protein